MSELVETLAYLHELDMVHHDLQTGHLLLTAQNQLKLAGFATFHSQMAGQAAREATTPVGNVYEAPEWRLDHELTSLSNIYSVGAILYELLAGQPPQPLLGEWVVTDSCVVPLLEVCPDLSPQTVELVHTCLADQPNGRYQTMWAVQQAMHQALVAEKKLLKRRHSPNLFDLLALIRQQFGRDTLVACALLIGLGLVALLTSENSELGVVEKIYVFVNTYLGLIPILLLVVLLVIKELLYGFAEDVLIRKIEPMLNHLLVPLMFIGGFIFCLQLVQMIITL
jgi:serine/threonine protein kinase